MMRLFNDCFFSVSTFGQRLHIDFREHNKMIPKNRCVSDATPSLALWIYWDP